MKNNSKNIFWLSSILLISLMALSVFSYTVRAQGSNLAPNAGLQGTVTDSVTNEPLEATIAVLDEEFNFITETVSSAATGQYSIVGLPAESYKIEVSKQLYIRNFYPGTEDFDEATSITLTEGGSATFDPQLLPFAKVTGTVTSQVGGEPLEGAFVGVYPEAGEPAIYDYDFTDENGVFEINFNNAWEPRGTVIRFNHYCGSNVPCSSQLEEIISVGNGESFTISVALAKFPVFTGTVKSASTGEYISATVKVYSDEKPRVVGGGPPVGGYITPLLQEYELDCTGTEHNCAEGFEFIGEPEIEYYFEAAPHPAVVESTPYLSEFFDNKYKEQAQLLEANLNEVAGDIDFTLDVGGNIAGVVKSEETSERLDNVEIKAFLPSLVEGEADILIDSTFSEEDGSFLIPNLKGMTQYELIFSVSDQNYLDLTLSNVSVTAAQTTTIAPQLLTGGIVSGVITAEDSGEPIEGAYITLYDSLAQTYSTKKSMHTDENGGFQFDQLDTGDYYLFIGYGRNTKYISQYYGGSEEIENSEKIEVIQGETTHITDSLVTGGTIVAHFVDFDTSELITSTEITLFLYNSEGGEVSYERGRGSPFTNDGVVIMEGIKTGTYYPWGSPENYYWPYTFFEGVQRYAPAEPFVQEYGIYEGYLKTQTDPIQLTEGTTNTVILPLKKLQLGSITGTISAAENGEPLPSIKVNLYQVDMQDEEKILVDSTYSDDVGQYNFADVEANYTYIVVAEKDLDSPWWQANREFLDETSGLLHIQNGVASVIDFSLEKGGTITGQIVDSSTNQPISRVSIDIFEKVIQDKGVGFNRITTVETDEEGNYRSIGLESNDYVLTFNYYYGNGETFYQPEVFDDEPLISKLGDFDLNTPTPVSVLQGVETVLNEELTPPPISTGTITGVVSGSGEVVSDFYIELYKNTEKGLKVVYGGIYLPDSPVELLKDNEGYQLTGIPDGDYYLKVIPQRDFLTFENSEEDAADYRETWYGGTQHWEESQMVSIVNGNTVSNVDIDLELGSRLFGTFSVGTAFPFNSYQVRVNEVKFYNHDGEFLFDGVVRDDFVDVQGLWPGEYYLYFPTYEHRVLGNGNSRTFYGEWYGDASSLESSTPLIVTGEEESFIKLDVALALDNPPPSLPDQPPAENIHKVSGTVTADGEPLLGVTITTDNGATTVTDSNGDYSLYLKDGSHTLTPSKNGYTFSPADLSVTVNGADLSGQNFTATALPTGSLSGIITEDDSSIPLEGVDVLAYEQNGAAWQFAQIATTDENGAYQLSDLVAAKYKLLFRVVSKTHKSEYYDNASSFSQGVAISLASGGSATDIHASLKKRPEAAIIAEGIDQFTDPESGEVTLTAGRGENNSVTISRNVSCESGDPADVQLIIGSSAFEMSDSGNGAYSATLNIPGDVTSDSTQNMSVQYVCNGFTETVSVGELVLYDPSGVITDAETDEPIIGASVTLYRVAGASPDTGSTTNECRTIDTRPVPVSGLPFGAWSGVPAADISAGHPVDAAFDTLNGQSLFSPAIPTQVTGEDGKYGWDVAEGCWYVVVEAEGFDTLVSPMVGVPPAVLDLDIALSKPAPPPPPPPISFDILLPLIGR